MTCSKGMKVALTAGFLVITGIVSAGSVTAGGPLDNLPPEKQALERQLAENRSVGVARAVPKTPENGRPPNPEPQQQIPMGVFEGQESPFPPGAYRITNRWQGVIKGEQVIAYAGAQGKDQGQGVVVVVTIQADRSKEVKFYTTPSKLGALKVISAVDSKLVVQAENGTTLAFDLLLRTFTEP